jgi:L-aspartate oxidase
MGGVATDLDGRTSLPHLFAAGEVACTGVHGANRLASNSLLEGLVFGGRAGAAMRRDERASQRADSPVHVPGPAGAVTFEEARLRALMWEKAGVFRDRDGLTAAWQELQPACQAIEAAADAGAVFGADDWRRASLLTVAGLIVRAALAREESRGAHSRTDFPDRDDIHWHRRIFTERRPGASAAPE